MSPAQNFQGPIGPQAPVGPLAPIPPQEPIASGPSSLGNGKSTPPLVPGPLTAAQAPSGPSDKLSLSADVPGAFQASEPVPDAFPYFSIGPMFLQRQNLGHQPVAFTDIVTTNANQVVTQTTTVPVQTFGNLTQPFQWGLRGTVGYYWNGEAVELSGFGIFQENKGVTASPKNGLNSLFNSPPVFFDSTPTGIWTNANSSTTDFKNSIAGAELNYRYKSDVFFGTELIMGVRYVNQSETLGVTTINGFSDPTAQATYSVHTANNVIAPQLGLEWSHTFLTLFTLGFDAKGALGADISNTQTQLVRGDGYLGFSNSRSSTNLGGIWEFCPFLDFNLTEKFHIRAAYTALWLTGMTLAVDQVDFNLANPAGRTNHDGTVFYHGPSLEFQFSF